MTPEVEQLRQWKAEAMTVLGEWEQVWETAGRPGALGESKAVAVLDHYKRIAAVARKARSAAVDGFAFSWPVAHALAALTADDIEAVAE
jgi:hypothetical protein